MLFVGSRPIPIFPTLPPVRYIVKVILLAAIYDGMLDVKAYGDNKLANPAPDTVPDAWISEHDIAAVADKPPVMLTPVDVI